MKRIKLILMALLTVMTATLGIFGLAFTAEADESNAFTMVEGASAKLTEEGMRFIVKMGSEVKAEVDEEDTKLYFVISPKAWFDEVADHNYYGMEEGKKLLIEADKAKIYSEGGYYYANGCITQIRAGNRARVFNATPAVPIRPKGIFIR